MLPRYKELEFSEKWARRGCERHQAIKRIRSRDWNNLYPDHVDTTTLLDSTEQLVLSFGDSEKVGGEDK